MIIEALQTGLEYARLALADHDAKYGRHPSMESDRKIILDDIKLIEDSMDMQRAANGAVGVTMEMVNTLIVSINNAHLAETEDWRTACWESADRTLEKIQEAIASAQQPATVIACGIPGMAKTTCPYCEQGFAFEHEQPATGEPVGQVSDLFPSVRNKLHAKGFDSDAPPLHPPSAERAGRHGAGCRAVSVHS